MTNSFYIYAPSNTKGEGNTSSQFTIQLPKKLEFHSQWYVALTNIIYSCSWDTLGTEESQYIDISWTSGIKSRMIIPSASYKSADEIIDALHKLLEENGEKMCKPKNRSKRNVDFSNTSYDSRVIEMVRLQKEILAKKQEFHREKNMEKKRRIVFERRMLVTDLRTTVLLLATYEKNIKLLGFEDRLAKYNQYLDDVVDKQQGFEDFTKRPSSTLLPTPTSAIAQPPPTTAVPPISTAAPQVAATPKTSSITTPQATTVKPPTTTTRKGTPVPETPTVPPVAEKLIERDPSLIMGLHFGAKYREEEKKNGKKLKGSTY